MEHFVLRNTVIERLLPLNSMNTVPLELRIPVLPHIFTNFFRFAETTTLFDPHTAIVAEE